CDLLWMQDDKHIDDKKIIGEVYDLASSKFGNDDIALSPYAVNGVKNWLLSLDPPFLKREGRQVIISSSRNHCSLELVLLAIDLYYVSNNMSYGTPILMRPGKARAFANTCLLDENSVEDLIELSVKMFKELLRWQSSTWGRSLILRRQVDILELQGLIP
ncbi:MAG: hypothetical protein KAW09_03215, partial [Thermoplasmata archaeon]|nr:hypothetical protein [Thermoplasmata archaeon]